MTNGTLECPWCGALAVGFDEVDVGVGMMQCGPAGCEACHAVEMRPDDVRTLLLGGSVLTRETLDGGLRQATDEEIKRGWWQGDRETQPCDTDPSETHRRTTQG